MVGRRSYDGTLRSGVICLLNTYKSPSIRVPRQQIEPEPVATYFTTSSTNGVRRHKGGGELCCVEEVDVLAASRASPVETARGRRR